MNLQLKESLLKLSEKAEKVRLQSNGVIKKTIIATLVVSTISVNTAFANPTNTTKLQKIYHVYINNEYLGTVSDKAMVENLVNEKVDQAKEVYKGFELSLKTDEIVFVPEQMFRETKVEDETVLDQINSEVDVVAEAVALKIDGEVITYLENQDKVDELVNQMKLQYVTQEQLDQLEAQKQAVGELPPLKEGESRLLDVHLTKNVTVSLEDVKPEQVLPVDKALQLLKKGTLEEEKYKIQEGDVLGSIATKHGLKLKQLLELNPEYTEESLLHIGDELNVTVYKPYVDVLIEKEVNEIQEIGYNTKVIDDSSMYKGDSKVVQKGSKGEKSISYVVSQVNGQQVNKEITSENVLKEPVEEIVHKGTKVVPSRGTGAFVWPTNGGYISSYQGYRWGALHKGIDIARPSNYTIKAADNGTVVEAGWSGSYGNKIVINHNNGLKTIYAHLSSINVSVGQTVVRGSQIGIMGSTGNSTGVHLHFEVYKNGALQNPLSYLN